MKIRINTQACGDPLNCRLCLDRCPEKVFGTYPRVSREPGVPAQDWVVLPIFASQCTTCLECVAFCPQQAISVQQLSFRHKIGDAIALGLYVWKRKAFWPQK